MRMSVSRCASSVPGTRVAAPTRMAQSNSPNKRPGSRGEPRPTRRTTSADWWQDEPPVPYTGSSSDPLFDDYNLGDRSAWAPGYVGDGNYYSGDYPSDEPLYDYGY